MTPRAPDGTYGLSKTERARIDRMLEDPDAMLRYARTFPKGSKERRENTLYALLLRKHKLEIDLLKAQLGEAHA